MARAEVDIESEINRSKRQRTFEPEDQADDDGDQAEQRDGGVDDSPEEVCVPRLLCDPGRPTARERAEHNASHYQYRLWCRH